MARRHLQPFVLYCNYTLCSTTQMDGRIHARLKSRDKRYARQVGAPTLLRLDLCVTKISESQTHSSSSSFLLLLDSDKVDPQAPTSAATQTPQWIAASSKNLNRRSMVQRIKCLLCSVPFRSLLLLLLGILIPLLQPRQRQ